MSERNVESSSDREEEEEEIASANGSEAEAPKKATTTLKTTVRKQKVIAHSPSRITLKIAANIVRTVRFTGH